MKTILVWSLLTSAAYAGDDFEQQKAILRKAFEKLGQKDPNVKAMDGDFDKLADLVKKLGGGIDSLEDFDKVKNDILKEPGLCGDFKDKIKKLLSSLDALTKLIDNLAAELGNMQPAEEEKAAHAALLTKLQAMQAAFHTEKMKFKDRIKQATKLRVFWMLLSGMLDKLCKKVIVEPPPGEPPVQPPKAPEQKNEETGRVDPKKIDEGFRKLGEVCRAQPVGATQGRYIPVGTGGIPIPGGKTATITLEGVECTQPEVPLGKVVQGPISLPDLPANGKGATLNDPASSVGHLEIVVPPAETPRTVTIPPGLISPRKSGGFEFTPLDKAVGPASEVERFLDAARLAVEQKICTDPMLSANPEYFRALLNQSIFTYKSLSLTEAKLREYVRAQVALQVPKERKDADKIVDAVTVKVVETTLETCKQVPEDRFDPETLKAVQAFVPGPKATIELK